MAEECTFYYYDHGYCCGKMRANGKEYEVNDDQVHKYCWGYHYDDCPVYRGRAESLKEAEASSSSSSSSSSSDGCYLTSACVVSRNLPDDCEELRTLRLFRDRYMLPSPEMKKDVEEYYRVAPGIVTAIDRSEDPAAVWQKIYDELIVPCVRLIKGGDYEQTYRKYKDYTVMLKKKFC